MANQEEISIDVLKASCNKRKKHVKLKGGDAAFLITDYLVFGLFALLCFFPFYYLFINTVSNSEMVARGDVNFYPIGFTLQNYKDLLALSDLGRAFVVTVSRTVIGTALMVVASAFCGYLVTKKEMWNRKFWYRFLVITMYFNAGLIPGYTNMLMLGLTDNFLGYIIPAIVQPFNIILVKTYIESIPGELEESAFIDGAGHMMIFRKVILPLSKPILATIAIFGAVGHWNSFMDSVINMQNSPNLHTLQHKLYIWLNQSSNIASVIDTGRSSSDLEKIISQLNSGKVIKYTIAMVTVLPILLVYPWMQKYFEKGIMLGAVKG
jgi:multiple sugar transport system permease protein/putative aldouronate transport system permease protein